MTEPLRYYILPNGAPARLLSAYTEGLGQLRIRAQRGPDGFHITLGFPPGAPGRADDSLRRAIASELEHERIAAIEVTHG